MFIPLLYTSGELDFRPQQLSLYGEDETRLQAGSEFLPGGGPLVLLLLTSHFSLQGEDETDSKPAMNSYVVVPPCFTFINTPLFSAG